MFFETFVVNIFLFFINFMLVRFMFEILWTGGLIRKIIAMIGIFLNICFLILLLHLEFLAFVLIIIYVGAIAVLFLFVVMLINIKQTKTVILSNYQQKYFILFISLLFFLTSFYFSTKTQYITMPVLDLDLFQEHKIYVYPQIMYSSIFQNSYTFNNFSELHLFGSILWNNYSFLIIGAGFLLLISIIGSIVLVRGMFIFNREKKKLVRELAN